MKFIILLTILVLVQARLKRKLKRGAPEPIKVKLFCDDDTQLKFYIENGNPSGLHFRRDCNTMQYGAYDNQGDIAKCNTKDYKIKKPNLQRLSVTELVKYPMVFMLKMLRVSDCKNKLELINKVYEDKSILLKKSGSFFEVGINIDPQQSNDSHAQFFDVPANKILYYGSPTGVNLDLIVDQINKFPGIPDEKKIKLDNRNDLEIQLIGIHTRPFKLGSVHELLSLCTSNGSTKYFFILHRGAKKGGLYTAVKISYYKMEKENFPCEDGLANKIDANSQLKGAFDMIDKCDSTKSLKILIDLAISYTENKSLYRIFSKNCQHFATGFTNLLSGASTTTSNINKNRLPKFVEINKLFIEKQEEYDKNQEKLNEGFSMDDDEFQKYMDEN